MRKAFALFVFTSICVGTLLPASVSGKRSQNPAARQDDSRATVQSNPEVQFGEHAVTGRVKNMERGQARGRHMVPDKEYEPRFDPDGLTKLGYTVDPVVQTTVPDDSLTPLMAPATAPAQDAPSPDAEGCTSLHSFSTNNRIAWRENEESFCLVRIHVYLCGRLTARGSQR